MKHLLQQTATVYDTKTIDRYGRDSWSDSRNIAVSVRYKDIYENQDNTSIKTADTIFYIDGDDSAIRINNRIDYDGNSYKITKIIKNRNGIGEVNHTTVESLTWNT